MNYAARLSLVSLLVVGAVVSNGCGPSRRGGGTPPPPPPPSCATICTHVLSVCAGMTDLPTCTAMCDGATASQRACANVAATCTAVVSCTSTSCACDTGGGCQTGCTCDLDCGASDPCAMYGTCGDCTAQSGCGFCGSAGACASGSATGPATGSCGSGWAWQTSDCSAGCTCDTTNVCNTGCTCDPECSGGPFGASCSCDAGPGVIACSDAVTCDGRLQCLTLGASTGFCTAECSASMVDTRCAGGGLCTRITFNGSEYFECTITPS